MNKLYLGDCLEVMKTLPENSVDSIVTDPPYELGFMGKKWDNSGIAYSVPMWKEVLRVLKPGGHLLSFSGTRTYHRMAVAIEDAGFEVRDMIEWVYSTGFPKSLNIGKAVDKLQGNEREETDYIAPDGKKRWGGNSFSVGEEPDGRGINKSTKGTSEYEGWGTALKPAHEPICMARKPLAEKTVAENCLKWGTGGINIDESRVGYTSEYDKKHQDDIQKGQLNADNGKFFGGKGQSVSSGNLQGRFPANLIHDNSEEVRECFPETKTGKAIRSNSGGKTFGGENTKPIMEDLGYEDGGGNASRFFKSIKKPYVYSGKEYNVEGFVKSCKPQAPSNYNDEGSPARYFKSIIYQAKASKSERNKGCEGLEEKVRVRQGLAGEKKDTVSSNSHPTVKPIALMEYLIKMITPKGGIVLDPFTGSGSTLVAAKENGFNFIGIELTKEYIPIIEARTGVKLERDEVDIINDYLGPVPEDPKKKNLCECGGIIRKLKSGDRCCEDCLTDY